MAAPQCMSCKSDAFAPCEPSAASFRLVLLPDNNRLFAAAAMSLIFGRAWIPFRRHALGGIVEELHEPVTGAMTAKTKTWGTSVSRVPSWPEEARPLKQHDWVSYLFMAGDILLVLLPIYFICM
jgi:hypothetical protein